MPAANSNGRLIKGALVLYFLFAAYVFLKLRNSASSGYEISLYAGTPWETWVLLGIGELSGIWIIAWHALHRKQGNGWVYGFLLIAFSNLIVVSLWVLRGYFNWAGNDPNAHYGMVTDYIATGHVKDTNTYPTYHVAMVQAQLLTGLSVSLLIKIYPAFLTMVSMVLVLLLAKLVIKEKAAALLAVAASAPLLYGLYHLQTYPRGLGQVLLPGMIWLYLFARSEGKAELSAAMLLCVGGFILVHPMVNVFLLLFLGAIDLSRLMSNMLTAHLNGAGPGGVLQVASEWTKLPLAPFLIGTVGFFLWFSWGSGFSDIVGQLAMSLRGERESGWFLKAMSEMQIHGWNKIEFFVKLYWPDWLMWALSGIGMLLVIKRFLKRDSSVQPLFVLLPWVFLSNVVWIPFFRYVGGSALIETSTLSAVAAVFTGWLLWYLFGQSVRSLALKAAAVTGIIAIVAAGGVLSLYRSPYVFQASGQMLKSDTAVDRWLLDRRLPYVPYVGIGVAYTVGFLEIGETALDYDRPDLHNIFTWSGILSYNEVQIPPHFGYEAHQTFGEQFIVDKYVILTRRFDIARNEPTLRYRGRMVGPAIGRWDFDDGDMVRWEQDVTVDRVYDNGESRAYLTHGQLWQVPSRTSAER